VTNVANIGYEIEQTISLPCTSI